MHRAGVVGDHQLAQSQPFDHFGQRSFAAQIQRALWPGAQNHFTERFVLGGAEDGKTRVGKMFCEQANEPDKILHRPAFVFPACAGLDGNPARAVRLPFGFDGGGDGGTFGQPLKMVVNRHAESRQHGEIPVHGVGVERGAADGDIIKSPRAFTDFIEADEKLSVGEPGERAAAREALEINDPVEILFAHPAEAAEHLRPVARRRPALALEADDAGQIGIAFEERRESGINPPENFACGQMTFEQPEDGKGLDDIAERAGFENEDFQRQKAE